MSLRGIGRVTLTLANIDHDTLYVGNGLLAGHSASHLDVSATTCYQSSYTNWEWHLIHILNKADTIPPTVAISSPTNGQIFASSTIAVSGTANDAGCPSTGVSLVQAQMNGTGGTWQTASGTNNWSASVSLNSGANTIYVRSKDGAGNYSTVASVNVTYTPPDTQGPALAITSPANNATVTSASLPVSGTASDSGCGNNGVSSLTVNGVSASGGTASGAGTANWNATVTLNPGTNLVTVTAKDTLNNSSQKQTTVTYNPPPPVLEALLSAVVNCKRHWPGFQREKRLFWKFPAICKTGRQCKRILSAVQRSQLRTPSIRR